MRNYRFILVSLFVISCLNFFNLTTLVNSCEIIGFVEENIGDDIRKDQAIYNTPCEVSGSFSDSREMDCFNEFAPLENDSRRFTSTASVEATLVEDGFDGDVFRQLYDVEASFVIGYYQFVEESSTEWYFGVTGTAVVEYRTQKSFRWKLLDSGGFVKISSDQFHDVELLNPDAFLCSGPFIPDIHIGHGHEKLEIGSTAIKVASISGTSISIWCGETSTEGTGFCGDLGGTMEDGNASTTGVSTPTGVIKGVLKSPATFETGSAGHPIHSAVVELYKQNSGVREQNEDETADKYIQFLVGEGRSFVDTITIKQEDFSVFQFDDVPLFESVPTDGSAPIQILYTIQITNAKTEIVESDDPEVANDVEIEYFNHALSNIPADDTVQPLRYTIKLEPIESYVVNSTGDDRDENPSDGICDTGNVITRGDKQELECTLRAAIDEANWNLDADRIIFDIPELFTVISPTSALPKIIDPVTIDGTTQSRVNTSGITTIAGVGTGNSTPVIPTITLDGRLAGRSNGFHITAGESLIKGMMITNFDGNGIFLENGNENRVEGNFIGIDEGGRDQSNWNGVAINNSSNNLIGGITNTPGVAPGNVISGNRYAGIIVDGKNTKENKILGNLIGTNKSGGIEVGNGGAGVFLKSDQNIVGGAEEGAGNVISANKKDGINIAGNDNIIKGNMVGTSKDGNIILGNGHAGVAIQFKNLRNIIGGVEDGAGNVISGNKEQGIVVGDVDLFTADDSDDDTDDKNNIVQGNMIGTNIDGNVVLKNESSGIFILSNGNIIGGSEEGTGNLICGNGGSGIEVHGDNNAIKGNTIGTDKDGNLIAGNLMHGISMSYASNNIINAANIIVDNKRNGIFIAFSKMQSLSESNNKIQGNFIGETIAGDSAVNTLDAISIRDSSDNAIGGGNGGDGNNIRTNNKHGVSISSFRSRKNIGSGNKILSNNIFIENRTGNSSGLGVKGISLSGSNSGDDKDSDEGVNNGQNSPILITAEIVNFGDNLEVTGTLNSEVGKIYTLQFFKGSTCDTELIYEYIGQMTTEATDKNGNVNFNFLTDSGFAAIGNFISATATDPEGNTSEISFPCIKVTEE